MEGASTPYLVIMLLALLSGLTTLIGVGLAIFFGKNIKGIALGIGFSAGIMLLVSFLELIPEAINSIGIETTVIAVISGIVLIGILHWVIPHTHLVQEKGIFNRQLLRRSYLVAFGLILHDVPEGFAMANSFMTLPAMGVMVALAVALHNIPEEFAMAAPIAAFTRRRFLFGAALISGLAEPLGAAIGLYAVHVKPTYSPLFMAVAAGAMIFVSIHELIPMAKIYRQSRLFITGMVISVIVYVLLSNISF